MQYHLIVTLPIFLLLHTGLAFTFKKAGESWWKGLVPLYNVYVWLGIVRKPKWWIIFYMIPVLNFIMGIGIILDLIKAFGKHKFIDHALAVIFPYFYFLYLGLNKKDQYQAGSGAEPVKGTSREWLDAILFAGVAALVIRTFLLEAFMIPTTSMEGSLLAGDFLFVSKVHYGVRMPMAPLSVPFVHNTLPLTKGTKSYLDWITLPYSRLPALKDINRNEIVVFNYPDDDRYPDVEELGKIDVISMKQNYIKRCVAKAGDVLEIRDRQIYIDGKIGWNPEFMQFSYLATGLFAKTLEKEGFRLAPPEENGNAFIDKGSGAWVLQMNETRYQKLKTVQGVSITPMIEDLQKMDLVRHRNNEETQIAYDAKYALFPKAPDKVLWTKDDFGPLWIPKKGESIPLNDSTLTFYEKCIKVYEHNTLDFKDGKYYLNGEVATSYTFKMDYYWMMGDNRHQSLDSRYWGFVPEDHIVGRPWFVLFSFEGGPRWDRFFKPATKWEP